LEYHIRTQDGLHIAKKLLQSSISRCW